MDRIKKAIKKFFGLEKSQIQKEIESLRMIQLKIKFRNNL